MTSHPLCCGDRDISKITPENSHQYCGLLGYCDKCETALIIDHGYLSQCELCNTNSAELIILLCDVLTRLGNTCKIVNGIEIREPILMPCCKMHEIEQISQHTRNITDVEQLKIVAEHLFRLVTRHE